MNESSTMNREASQQLDALGLPVVASDAVTAIAPGDRVPKACAAVQRILREICIDDGHVFIGFASVEPGTASHWHDHGDHTTYALPLQGESAVEFGEPIQRMPLLTNGTVYVVPPGLRHREMNVGTTRSQTLIVRVGPAPAPRTTSPAND